MFKIFITGSTDGLGFLGAKSLLNQGHAVVLHARNAARVEQLRQKLPQAQTILIAELSDLQAIKNLAAEVNTLGQFDAIIHNAGVYETSAEMILKVNTLAPYVLTCLIQKPQRLIYLSSQMHRSGSADISKINLQNCNVSYSDSKLHDLILAKAVARKWPDVFSNAVDPGWVPTKMGGSSAPDDLNKGYQTQVWLAVSDEAQAKVSGRYFFHQKEDSYYSRADDVSVQDAFLKRCEEITGVVFSKS